MIGSRPNSAGSHYTILRADRVHSNCLNYPINREACKVYDLLQPFQAGNYHYFSFAPPITGTIAIFTVKRSFSSLHHDSKSKDVDAACNIERWYKSKQKQIEFQIFFFQKYYHAYIYKIKKIYDYI